MVSFFGIKIGGDRKKKLTAVPAAEVVSAKTRRRLDLDEPAQFDSFNHPQAPKTRNSSARPGTAHSFRSVSAPRPMFMNGTATASLVDLPSFDHIPRTRERFSVKPPAAVGGFGPPRSRASSKANPERLRTNANSKPWAPIEPKSQESLPITPMRSDALDSLFGGDDTHEHDPITKGHNVLPRLSPIVPPASLEAAITASADPITPLTHSSLPFAASPARSYGSGASPRTFAHSPSGPGSPYSPNPNSPASRSKMPPNSAFKPYSPTAALATSNAVARTRSPSAGTLQNTKTTTISTLPALNTSFSAPNSALEQPTTISASTSPMLPESPFSQFNFEFEFGASSTGTSTAPSSVAATTTTTTTTTIDDQSICSPALDRNESFSRASASSPSPSLSLTANTGSGDSALSPRPSLSNSSSARNNIPSPSHSVGSARSAERPSFERAPSTKPAAPSGLRVVRNAIPSIGPDNGLGISAPENAPSSFIVAGNFGARSPTSEDNFVLHSDEALALQWEGPLVIRDVAAKRDTFTLSSPRRPSFTFDINGEIDDLPLAIMAARKTPDMNFDPERPKTSAGPATNTSFSTFGSNAMPSFTRSCSTDAATRSRRVSGTGNNSRLSALRPANLKLSTTTVAKTVRAMPKSPLSVAPQSATLQTPVVASSQPSRIGVYDITRSQSPLLNIAMRSPTFGMPMPRLQDREGTMASPTMVSPAVPVSPAIHGECMDSPASIDSMSSLNSPPWQSSSLTPAMTLDVHMGMSMSRAAATWDPQQSQPKTVAVPPGITEPRSAIAQTVDVTWPLMGDMPSPPGSPEASATYAVGIQEKLNEPRISRSSTKQPMVSERQDSLPCGRTRRPMGAPSSVRDRVRNLEVCEMRGDERSRSRSRDTSAGALGRQLEAGTRLQDASLPRPPPKQQNDQVNVAVTSDGFI